MPINPHRKNKDSINNILTHLTKDDSLEGQYVLLHLNLALSKPFTGRDYR